MMHREGDAQLSDERIVTDDGVGVVHDPALTPDLDACWFDPAYWQGRNGMQPMAGGRGGVFVVDTPLPAWWQRRPGAG